MHHDNRHEPRATSTARGDQIAALHRAHARGLERRIARGTRADAQTIEDACSFAWLQLLTHASVDLGPPPAAALAWLALAATREAWRLKARRARDALIAPAAIEHAATTRGVRSGS